MCNQRYVSSAQYESKWNFPTQKQIVHLNQSNHLNLFFSSLIVSEICYEWQRKFYQLMMLFLRWKLSIINVANVSMNPQFEGKNIGLPQELILQDHLKYIMWSYMVYHEQTLKIKYWFCIGKIIPYLSSSPNHNGRIFHPYGSTQWKIIIAFDGFSINVINLCMLYIVVWIWNIFRKLDLFKNWNPK